MEGEQNSADVEDGLFRWCGRPSGGFGFGHVVPAVVDEETESVPCAPEGEVPGHAVPEADEEHGGDLGQQDHHRDGHRFLPRPEPAGDGIEEIGAEPLGKSHVPVVPELGQVGFEVGRGEVFREFDSEQLRNAESDVGVAAEIEVDLEGVGVDDDPHPKRGGDLGCVRVVQGDEGKRVGDDEFFEGAH